jgi:hypothetical protein
MDKKLWGFHLFGANFASDEEAKLYAFEQGARASCSGLRRRIQ